MILAWVVNPEPERRQIEFLVYGIFECCCRHGRWYLAKNRSLSSKLVEDKACFSKQVDAINGFIRLSSIPLGCIDVAGWYYRSELGEIRPILEAPTNLSARFVQDKVNSKHQQHVRGVLGNKYALEAYACMSAHGDWYGLYMAHEVIKKNIDKDFWCDVVSEKEWRRLGQTANSYRHSNLNGLKVENPMSYHDAQSIMSKVLFELVRRGL